MSVLVSDILLPPYSDLKCDSCRREKSGDYRQRPTSGQFHPNNVACSGTVRLPRGLLPVSDPGRCPKINTELLSMASSTKPAGSLRVPSKAAGASIKGV